MDIEEFRGILDKMKPEEIRRLIQKQNLRTKKMSSKRDIFRWIEIILMQIILTQIILGFYMLTDKATASQLLFAVFIESFALVIVVTSVVLQKKLNQFQNLSS